MNCHALEQWEALSEGERERLMASWDIYGERGYWVELFEQAVDELQRKFRENSNVTQVFMANHQAILS